MPSTPRARAQPARLRVLVTTPSAHDEIATRAGADLGMRIEMTGVDSQTLVERVLHAPDSFDVVQMEYWMIKEVLPAGRIQGIPAAALQGLPEVMPLFTHGRVDGQPVSTQGTAPHAVQFLHRADSREAAAGERDYLTLAPTVCNSDTLGWRPDAVPRPVTSWADLLDPAFRGRVALADLPSVTIVEAALACEALSLVQYENKGDLTRAQIDATLAVLARARGTGQFHGWWRRYEESVAFMRDGPVSLQAMWPPAVTALMTQGMALRYQPLKEGSRGWAGGLALAADLQGAQRGAALEYINWYQSGWAGAFLSRQGYYSATPALARRHLTADEWAYWYEGTAAQDTIRSPVGMPLAAPGALRPGGSLRARMGHIACWSSRMREQAYLQKRWTQFMAA